MLNATQQFAIQKKALRLNSSLAQCKRWNNESISLENCDSTKQPKWPKRKHMLILWSLTTIEMKNDHSKRGVRPSRDSKNLYLHVISVCSHVSLQTVTAYTKSHINFKISYDIPGIDTAPGKKDKNTHPVLQLRYHFYSLQFHFYNSLC